VRLGEDVEQVSAEGLDVDRVRPDALLDEDAELVTRESAGEGVLGQVCAESLRDAPQQAVAALMSEAVVDELEAVEVEEQDGVGVRLAGADAADGILESAREQFAVGQVREAIVLGEPAEAFAGLDEFGDVGERSGQTSGGAVLGANGDGATGNAASPRRGFRPVLSCRAYAGSRHSSSSTCAVTFNISTPHRAITRITARTSS